MGVAFNPLLHERGEKRPLSPLTMGGYDVFIFGELALDTCSRNKLHRDVGSYVYWLSRYLLYID